MQQQRTELAGTVCSNCFYRLNVALESDPMLSNGRAGPFRISSRAIRYYGIPVAWIRRRIENRSLFLPKFPGLILLSSVLVLSGMMGCRGICACRRRMWWPELKLRRLHLCVRARRRMPDESEGAWLWTIVSNGFRFVLERMEWHTSSDQVIDQRMFPIEQELLQYPFPVIS